MTEPARSSAPSGAPHDPLLGPDVAALEEEAFELLGDGLAELRETVDKLAEDHFVLREQVKAAGAARPARTGGASVPPDLRWPLLDRPAASKVWLWLIDWVDWFVTRYQLTEEIPACWPQHPPLVDELVALAASWNVAYDPRAAADAPLRWLEACAKARLRLRDWDDATRCRNGEHHDRRVDLIWPVSWRDSALDIAEADLAGRPVPTGDEEAEAHEPAR